MKTDKFTSVGLTLATTVGLLSPCLAQAPPGPANPAAIQSRLKALGCAAIPGEQATILSTLRTQIRRCLEDPSVSASNRAQLTALEVDLTGQLSTATSALTAAELSPVLASLQRQFDQLGASLQSLQQQKQQSDITHQKKEQEFNQIIADLRSQVAALAPRPATENAITTTPAAPPTGDDSPPEQPVPETAQKAPTFKPTLSVKGSVNMVVGGVNGPSTSLSQNFWTARLQNSNREFSNSSVEVAPNFVTGATNKAGGSGYAYYREGQSNLFYPPNGLEPVDRATAHNYAMTSSWTGGKAKFDSLTRGGNLIITDPKDPNFVSLDPRTLDRAGHELTVNLKGQPVLPNAGLGGLKADVKPLQEVTAKDFHLGNLGADITFANIPMGERDIQNLLDLANVSREVKLGNGNAGSATRNYITQPADTISNIALANGITAARLLKLNPSLNQSIPLREGTVVVLPKSRCVKLCVGVNQVSDGGLVQNTAFYDDLLNLSIAEYGSLTGSQRNNERVLTAAQTFIRDLVGTTRDDDVEFEDFNFQRSYTFNNDVKLHFQASFFGPDLLNASLRYRNFVPYGERGRFPALNLAYGFGGINEPNVVFDRLYWQVPIFKDSYFFIGTRYKDYNFLPVSYGTFYPVEQQNYFFASGAGLADYVGAGAGASFNNIVKNFLGGSLSIGGGYIANPVDAVNPVSNDLQQKGIAGRDTRFRAPVQLGYKSDDNTILASLNYVFNRGDTLNSFIGTNLSANPFFYDIDQSNQLGATFAWEFKDNMSVNLVYNHFTYKARYDASVFGVPMVEADDIAKAQSWMAAFLLDDLFVKDSKMGLAIGQVPSVYYNESAWGTESKPFAFEAWYQYPLSDRLTLQPAVFAITNHDGFSNGGTDWGSTFRVYFNF